MNLETFILDISVVVICAAVLSSFALFIRQPLIVAYILCGVIAGPWGMGLIRDVEFIDGISRIGVTLLLFLVGIELQPRRLIELFNRTFFITIISSLLFCGIVIFFALLWGFSLTDSIYVGLALMFSSTVLVVKLLPTTTLHQKHMGAICVSVLILQDLIAIAILWFMRAAGQHSTTYILLLPVKGIFLIAIAIFAEQFVLRRIMKYADRFHETLYLLAIGWCLGIALLAHVLGYSHEVGAFIAGIALARSPIALFLSEGLKFFRDFFLILFFFVLGAKLNIFAIKALILPALILGIIMIAFKTLIFDLLFRAIGETRKFSIEVAIRVSQTSEFSLIIAFVAANLKIIGLESSQLIQLTTIITMIISSYLVIFLFPTPLGTIKALKQD